MALVGELRIGHGDGVLGLHEAASDRHGDENRSGRKINYINDLQSYVLHTPTLGLPRVRCAHPNL